MLSSSLSAPEARATRAALVQSAYDLFVERGYGAVSVRDLARQTQLTSGAIYGHFRNKADLLVAAIADHIERDLYQVGNAGDPYVSGYTASADLPTWNAFQPALAGPEDGFVLRMAFTATDATVAYATYLGGGDSDRLHAIAVDAAGNAYVAGYTESIDFPTFAPSQPSLNGARDAVVTRLNPAGMPTFSTFLGGAGDDTAWHLALHGVPGNTPGIYVAGETLSMDLGTDNAFEPHSQGASDGFVARIAPSP